MRSVSDQKLTLSEIREIVDTSTTMPGMRFSLDEYNLPQGFVRVILTWSVPDVKPPHSPVTAKREFPLRFTDRKVTLQEFLDRMKRLGWHVVTHEFDEWFRVGGERVTKTHTTLP